MCNVAGYLKFEADDLEDKVQQGGAQTQWQKMQQEAELQRRKQLYSLLKHWTAVGPCCGVV